MTSQLTQTLLFTLAPVATMGIGGVIAVFRVPPPSIASAIQHFAGGVVFAAVAVELLPDVVHRGAPLAAGIGFALGVAAMLGLRTLSRRLERRKESAEDGDEPKGAWSLLLIVGVDILIDGLLIGIAFAAGAREGVLIAIALAIELLSLGLATAAPLKSAGLSRRRSLGLIGGLASLPLVGAVVGVLLLGGLGNEWMEAMLAFAAAALLYLVTEELLVEAHEVQERPWMTAMFFLGFLILLLIDMSVVAGGAASTS